MGAGRIGEICEMGEMVGGGIIIDGMICGIIGGMICGMTEEQMVLVVMTDETHDLRIIVMMIEHPLGIIETNGISVTPEGVREVARLNSDRLLEGVVGKVIGLTILAGRK